MINPKETLRICGEYAAEVADVPNLETRFDVYAREALPEYAAWVKDAVPFLIQSRADMAANLLLLDPESVDGKDVEHQLHAVMKLLARVKHE